MYKSPIRGKIRIQHIKHLLVFGREYSRSDSGHMKSWPTYPGDELPGSPVSHHKSLQCVQAWASSRKQQNIVQDMCVFRAQKECGPDSLIPFQLSLLILPSFWKTGSHRILRDIHRLYHWNGRRVKKRPRMCLEGWLYHLRMWNPSTQHVIIELRKSWVVRSIKRMGIHLRLVIGLNRWDSLMKLSILCIWSSPALVQPSDLTTSSTSSRRGCVYSGKVAR